MAISWGSWSGLARLGIEFSRVAQHATTEVWQLDVYLGLSGWVSDNYNTLRVSGSFDYSGNTPVNSGATSALKLYSTQKAFSRMLGRTSGGHVSVSLSEFSGGSPSASAAFNVSARPYQPPTTPGGVSVTINPNQTATVRFTQRASTDAPVAGFDINQQTWPGGGTSLVGQPGSSRTSWTSSTLENGREYRFLVRQRGAGGTSDWAYTAWVQTRPVAPAHVTAERDTGNIVVTWKGMSDYRPGRSTYNIYRNGTRVATGITALAWTDTSPVAGEAVYEVAEVNSAGIEGPKGAALPVSVLAPPAAPSNLQPNGGYQPANNPIVFAWEHAPIDGTDQEAFELQYRVNTGSWTTVTRDKGSSNAKTLSYRVTSSSFTTGAVVEWQVRTKGAHADWGPWSPVAAVDMAARPTATITAPTSTITGNTTTVRITTNNTNKDHSWRAVAYVDGVEHDATSGYGRPPYTWPLTGLPNNSQLRIVATVQAEVESREASRTVKIEYAAPAKPTVSVAWIQATGAVQVQVDNPSGGVVAAVDNQVQRRVPGGTWETIAERVPLNGTVTDPVPPTHTAVEYRVIAFAATRAAAYSQPASPPGRLGEAIYLNWGTGWTESLRVLYNPEVGYSPGLAHQELVYFAGHTTPTLLAGPQTRETAKYAGTLVDDQPGDVVEQADRARQLACQPGLVMVRHPEQAPTVGAVSGMTVNRTQTGRYDLGFTHTKAR
ncbi:phage tail protein [Trueperella bialowiezensis]|uniref:Fibronectin type-III domain-containing protein n=1 Tax=Trueperella bialowiezensis TaxID=312285 RepID=A0A448PE80_9ACTO|nr:hypothetical protein [Trueperella bialowiezensis]VEI13210.1 Uncharacterised protein [Trueperella bialowiezensis]